MCRYRIISLLPSVLGFLVRWIFLFYYFFLKSNILENLDYRLSLDDVTMAAGKHKANEKSNVMLLSYGLMKQMHDEPSERRRQASGEKPLPLADPPSLSLFLSLPLWRAVFLESARFYQTQFKILTEEPGSRVFFWATATLCKR